MVVRSHTTGQVGTFRRIIVRLAISMVVCAFPAVALPAETGTKAVAERTVEKVDEKSVEGVAEEAIEKAVEQAVEKAAEKVEEKVAEKAELTAKRPEEWWETTKIHFFVFVVDIDNIDGAGQSFTANVYVHLTWKDERLAHEGNVRTVPLEETWNPRVIIINRGGLVQKSLPEIVAIKGDGTVIYRQRYTGPLSQPLKLSEFPFDQHDFTIYFVAAGYTPDEIEFIPNSSLLGDQYKGGSIYHELSLPDWNILKYQAQTRAYEAVKGSKGAGFAFQFTAKRYAAYYVWQAIVPLVLIVMMSWGAFYIDPTNAGAQIGVATSSMLTLIAYRFMLGQLIPRLPYMTRLDRFTLGSTILVFLTLAEVIITTNLALRQREKTALKTDHWCRLMFPALFILWSSWSLVL